jgi:PBP1b-binding outer membrane lipoprotein LpoB
MGECFRKEFVMGLSTKIAVCTLALGLALAGVGCEKSRDEMRPNMDRVSGHERGLQSRDLREMTDRMAPDMLTIPEIVQNPTKITIVMKPIENKTAQPERDLTIFVARLKNLLNSNASRDRLAFVEDQATLRALQAQELGSGQPGFEDGGRTGPIINSDPRIVPQYVLWGTFYEMDSGHSSYFLCEFRLTNINTGKQVWTHQYEVKTLN